MPRPIFVRTRLGLGLITLLLLGLSGPGPATALSYDTFSVSAHLLLDARFRGAGFKVTTSEFDFFGRVFITTFVSALPPNSFVGCIGGFGCRPGDHVFAQAAGQGLFDVSVLLTFPSGQYLAQCLFGFPANLQPEFCLVGSARMGWTSAPLPPFTGATETTVASTFFADLGASIRHVDGSSQFTPTGDGVGFFGTGSGQFDLVWQPDTNTWFPRSADGYIAATPEPTTVLLFGTAAAGLGLARWYRRRARERAHAA